MVSLGFGANVGRARTLGARLSYETDLDTGIQPIEVGAAAAMEEVVVAVFGGDKPESALSNELLDGSRHCVDLLSRTYCLALSRPVRAGPTASAPRLGAPSGYPGFCWLKPAAARLVWLISPAGRADRAAPRCTPPAPRDLVSLEPPSSSTRPHLRSSRS